MDDAEERLEALLEAGKRLIEEIEQGRLLDEMGNRFEQNICFLEFKRLVENREAILKDPEFRAFSELLDRRIQIEKSVGD